MNNNFVYVSKIYTCSYCRLLHKTKASQSLDGQMELIKLILCIQVHAQDFANATVDSKAIKTNMTITNDEAGSIQNKKYLSILS